MGAPAPVTYTAPTTSYVSAVPVTYSAPTVVEPTVVEEAAPVTYTAAPVTTVAAPTRSYFAPVSVTSPLTTAVAPVGAYGSGIIHQYSPYAPTASTQFRTLGYY